MPEPSIANNAPTASAVPKRRRSGRRDGRSAILMMGPNLGMFSLFIVIPIVAGIYLSFTTRQNGSDSPTTRGCSTTRLSASPWATP
jgi:ABC-type sugar transport system permease subunit